MPRQDWHDQEAARRRVDPRYREDLGQADYSHDYGYDPQTRAGYRTQDDLRGAVDDYGQADYSRDYAYDPVRREAYRGAQDVPPLPRSWRDEPASTARPHRRRGPSDRVLWAVIMERLDDERRLDLRDVEVIVEDAEVTLNGTVRHKGDKRRIEDVADIEGIRHVQNNLRVRDRQPWIFL